MMCQKIVEPEPTLEDEIKRIVEDNSFEMTEGIIVLNLKNVEALCPYDFEVFEEKLRKLLKQEGIEANVYDSVTGNEMSVRNDR
jgi:uridine kinase